MDGSAAKVLVAYFSEFFCGIAAARQRLCTKFDFTDR
jgi:hypothetical protein